MISAKGTNEMRKKTTTILALELILDDLTNLYYEALSLESDLELDSNISLCISMAEDQTIDHFLGKPLSALDLSTCLSQHTAKSQQL